MRGEINRQETMLSLLTPEQRVPMDHPLRKTKAVADSQRKRLSPVLRRCIRTPDVPRYHQSGS